MGRQQNNIMGYNIISRDHRYRSMLVECRQSRKTMEMVPPGSVLFASNNVCTMMFDCVYKHNMTHQ